jgi:uncharacterized membrane protein
MMNQSWISTLTYASTGLLFIVISIPLIIGKVPPNGLYGFRVRKTLENPKTWYAVNRIAGIDLCITGAVITIAALLLKLLLPDSETMLFFEVNIAILLISLTCVIVHALIVLKRY